VGKSLIEIARAVLQTEADSVLALMDRIENNFDKVCNTLKGCRGKVILIGMGKSGHIAKKISSTLASTGTPSFFLHPGEAGHGDLGMVTRDDVVIMISYSGEAVKLLALISETAIASPIDKAAVVLEVGAKLFGQASLSTLTSK
jgi:arabinose-5-phosphate isomerase